MCLLHVSEPETVVPAPIEVSTWPMEIRAAILCLETRSHAGAERRLRNRFPYRVQAELTWVDLPDADPVAVFTRDINSWTVGTLTLAPMQTGWRCNLRLPDPLSHHALEIACSVYRCTEFYPGWYDVALRFAKEHRRFHELE